MDPCEELQKKAQSLEDALKKIPRAALGCFPTPLHRLEGMSRRFGRDVLIKRDDLTGLGPGGNKIRSLEFLLGQARAEGCSVVLAAGPLQSNLCTLAAASAARLGLACELFFNAPEPERFEGNQLLNRLLGAKLRFLGHIDAAQREAAVSRRQKELASRGVRAFQVKNGATSGRGALGYTAAVPELLRQCRERGIEKLSLFAPGGNGGVAAGLIFGNALTGGMIDLHIVSVEDPAPVLKAHIAAVIREATALTWLPAPADFEAFCTVTDRFRGGGWGQDTAESAAMVPSFAASEGIFAEKIYTSKVLVAMERALEEGSVSGVPCWLHTGGLGSLFAQY